MYIFIFFVYFEINGEFMTTAEDLIYDLYTYYNVDNNIELAEIIKTTPQTISNWKSRNSVGAIRKKCRELGIFKDIFGDVTTYYDFKESKNKIKKGSLIDNSTNEDTSDEIQYEDIPVVILQELNTLFKREEITENIKKEFIEKFEDFIYELKKTLRK